ncbi:MAG: TetR/AcrR family transcriptional regulator [Marinifilaceae bacterium]
MSISTKQRIIEISFLLFLRKGFKAVTLEDIERETQITRGTFYYHFIDKTEVVKEGIEQYYRMMNNRVAQEFAEMHSLRDCVDLMIGKLHNIENYTARSFDTEIPEVLCLALIAEVISIYPEFREVVHRSKHIRLNRLEDLINQAILNKELREDIDAAVLAQNFLNIGVCVINYLVLHHDIAEAISSVKAQYDQLYELAKAN